MDWQTILFITVAIIVLLAVARVVNQLIMQTKITDALINHDNPAVGVEIAGYFMGVILIISEVLSGPGYGDIPKDAFWVAVYGTGGILFLGVVALYGLRLLLSHNCLKSIKDGNVAAGIVAAGSYIGTGAVIAGSVSGESGGPWHAAIIFFVAGQILFLLITYLFRLLTSYDDVKEILDNNISASLSYFGLMVAVGIIVGNALTGCFISYEQSFIDFGKSLLIIITLYPIRQWIVQGLLLGGGFTIYGGRLDSEISQDRNINAGVLEAAAYIATALLVIKFI